MIIVLRLVDPYNWENRYQSKQSIAGAIMNPTITLFIVVALIASLIGPSRVNANALSNEPVNRPLCPR